MQNANAEKMQKKRGIIITPNSRIEHHVRKHISLSSNLKVTSLSNWVQNTWEAFAYRYSLETKIKNLITRPDEWLIWEDAFSYTTLKESLPLFSVTNHIPIAIEAHNSIYLHNVDTYKIKFSNDFYEDHKLFLIWHDKFLKTLHERGNITKSMLPKYFLDNVDLINNILPENIILLRFDNSIMPSIWRKFWSELNDKAHLNVEYLDDLKILNSTTPMKSSINTTYQLVKSEENEYFAKREQKETLEINNAFKCSFKTFQEEVDSVARYLKLSLEKNLVDDKNMNYKIGVIVLDFNSSSWKTISQSFKYILSNELANDKKDTIFNMSLGIPLYALSDGWACYTLLRFFSQGISTLELINLINTSKFSILNNENSQQINYINSSIINKYQKDDLIKWNDFVKYLKNNNYDTILSTDEISNIQQKEFSIQMIKELLSSLGLNITDSFYLHKINTSLESISSSVDLINEYATSSVKHSFTDKLNKFLKVYYSTLNNTIIPFEKIMNLDIRQEDLHSKPIQVLGQLEGLGLDFDEIVIMQSQSDFLPSKVKYNSFLPISIQKKYYLDKASFEKENYIAKNWIINLAKNTKKLIFTYTSDEIKSGSYLIKNISNIDLINYKYPIDIQKYSNTQKISNAKNAKNIKKMQKALDNQIQNEEPIYVSNAEIKGGIDLLNTINQCYFKSFSKYRLKLSPIKYGQESNKYINRGTILHLTLEEIFKNENLYQLDNKDLRKYIQNIITKESNKIYKYRSNSLLEEVEKKYLFNLIYTLIERNKLLTSNLKPTQFELYTQLIIDEIKLNIKIDRIDTLISDKNKTIILDYKYKKETPIDLKYFQSLPNRIADCQLIAYLIAYPNAKGATYALLHHEQKDKTYIAIMDKDLDFIDDLDKSIVSVLSCNINHMKEQWSLFLSEILQYYIEGNASINPIAKACTHCDFKLICHI